MAADGWTIDEARAEFAKTGIPFDGLGKIISLLPGFQRIGEKPSGPSGGRGAAVYDIGELQQLHGALARWLIARETEGALYGVLPVVLHHGGYSSGMPESPERRRERYASDPEYHARTDARHAAYVAKNRLRLNARKRAAYAANPERHRARQRAYRDANPAEIKEKQRIRDARRDPVKMRVQQMYAKHGITPGEWVEIRTVQNGQCYLCDAELAAEPCRDAVVDHDHRCCGPNKSCRACRRGIACRRCNSIIGLAGDDPERLHQIADRLQAVLVLQTQRLASRPAEIVLF